MHPPAAACAVGRGAAAAALCVLLLLLASPSAWAADEEQLMLTEQPNCNLGGASGNGVLPPGIPPPEDVSDGTDVRSGTCSIVLPQLDRGASQLYLFRIASNVEMSFMAIMRARGGMVAMELYQPDSSRTAPDTSKPPTTTAIEVRSGGVVSESYVNVSAAQVASRPGVYALRLRGLSGSPTVEVTIVTPDAGVTLSDKDRDAMVGVAKDCCSKDNADSPFCGTIAPTALAPSHTWADDVCHLPPNLCDVKGRLISLSLRDMGLACSKFPPSIAALTALTRLDLGGNTIPVSVAEAADVLSKLPLTELHLANTGMKGTLDCALVKPKRKVIDVASNLISGTIPECLLSSPVEELYIYRNDLSGPLPSSDYSSSIITTLVASSQRKPKGGLTGSIPPALLSLSTLVFLHLANNDLSGELSSLPPNAVLVNVSSNDLSGKIPAFPKNLWAFDATANGLTGTLPQLGSLSRLETVLVPGNKLEGTLPTLPGGLVALDASYNRLKGSLPVLPPSLSVFDVNSNGGLEGDVGGLEVGGMQLLRLGNNSFTGKVPPSAAKSKTLAMLSLRLNKISGPLPSEWDTPSLQVLLLSDNQITGTIPASLALQPQLGTLRLERNRLGGTLEAFAKALPSQNNMFHFDVSGNQIGGPVPPQLERLGVFSADEAFVAPSASGQVAFRRVFNVSENMMTGSWPAWLLSDVPDAHLACKCPVLARVSGPDMRLYCPRSPAKLGDYQWQLASESGFQCWTGRHLVPLTDYLDSPNNKASPDDTDGTAFGDSGPPPLTPGGSAGLAIGMFAAVVIFAVLGYFVGYRRWWLERRAKRFERFDNIQSNGGGLAGTAPAAAFAAEAPAVNGGGSIAMQTIDLGGGPRSTQ